MFCLYQLLLSSSRPSTIGCGIRVTVRIRWLRERMSFSASPFCYFLRTHDLHMTICLRSTSNNSRAGRWRDLARPPKTAYGPIDAEPVPQYRFFGRTRSFCIFWQSCPTTSHSLLALHVVWLSFFPCFHASQLCCHDGHDERYDGSTTNRCDGV